MPVLTKPIDVADRKQLFIDERFVDHRENVTLTVNPPVKHDRVLLPEEPWEASALGYYASVLEDEGAYKMWYDCFVGTHVSKTLPLSICYATSDDGIHWRREPINRFDWLGHKENNIVLPGAQGCAIRIDPTADKEHRYQTLGTAFANDLWEESSKMHWDMTGGGIYLWTSPNGIEWVCRLPVASPFFHDSQNDLFYDPRIDKHVAYFRTHHKGRTLGRIELDDPMQTPWPHQPAPSTMKPNEHGLYMVDDFGAYDLVFACDEQDPPDSDLQIMPIFQYPWADDVYLGLATIYRHFPETIEGKFLNDGVQDVQLAVSRDGINWTRPTRKPYIPLGHTGEWDSSCIWPSLGMIRRGDEVWQYYSGAQTTHGTPMSKVHRQGGLGRLTQRLDGFVSVDTDENGGEFVTPPMTFNGHKLELNINCFALGHARVELQSDDGQPIPGYILEECIPIERNHVRTTVRWENGEMIKNLTSQSIRIRFSLNQCKLFAFQFSYD